MSEAKDPSSSEDAAQEHEVAAVDDQLGDAAAVGEVDVESLGSTADACGAIRSMAPSCLARCRSSCGAVNSAAAAFRRGGRDGARRSVCRNRWAFECFLRGRNYRACKPLIDRAGRFGFPRSVGGLRRECGRRKEPATESEEVSEQGMSEAKDPSSSEDAAQEHEATATEEASPMTQEELEALSAEGGVCGMVRSTAPECIDRCRSSCGAVNSVASAFQRNGRGGATDAMCRRKWAFECFFRNYHVCRPLISQSRDMGFPGSMEDLHRECHGRKGLPEDTEPTEEEPSASQEAFAKAQELVAQEGAAQQEGATAMDETSPEASVDGTMQPSEHEANLRGSSPVFLP